MKAEPYYARIRCETSSGSALMLKPQYDKDKAQATVSGTREQTRSIYIFKDKEVPTGVILPWGDPFLNVREGYVGSISSMGSSLFEASIKKEGETKPFIQVRCTKR